MGRVTPRAVVAVFAAILLALSLCAGAAARDDKGKADGSARLQIQVTGGDQNKPVAQASVYVKWIEDRRLRKDKTRELNIKTNEEGIAHSPEIPQGRILIQIIAPGWKTFGQWYDVNQGEQTIEIHLERPRPQS